MAQINAALVTIKIIISKTFEKSYQLKLVKW